MNAQLLSIKTKKFGVRLADFRQKKGVSADTLSGWTGISTTELEKIESGEKSISLPLIELIAYKLGLGTETLINGKAENVADLSKDQFFIHNYPGLRDRLIAISLRKSRLEQGKSVENVALKCGISEDELEQFESGNVPIPWPILECLDEEYQIPLSSMISDFTLTNEIPAQKNQVPEEMQQLPEELYEFIQNPANQPYLELAKRLSEMDAAKLRSIAEGLLEITY
jgi:transcriptional regulator with XRE-family HTH domain